MNPDFRSPRMLLEHIAHTMRFYHPRCINAGGGFYHFFMDDGSIYDAGTRHLVNNWRHFVDHRHGAWYRILSTDKRKLSAEKSPAGTVDYHTMGACYEVLNAVGGAA